MTTEVDTGRTRAANGTDLTPLVLGDKKGEQVFLLLHSEGRGAGKETLEEQAKAILDHAIVEGDGDAYTRLEGALKELNGLLKGLLLSDALRDVHALVGLLEKDGMLHLSHAGRAEAYLVRDGATAQITEYSRGKPTPSFVHIASGPLQPRDHVILSTQRLLRTITPAQLSHIAQRGGDVLKDVIAELESEKEVACLAHMSVKGEAQAALLPDRKNDERGVARNRRAQRRGTGFLERSRAMVTGFTIPKVKMPSLASSGKATKATGEAIGAARDAVGSFLKDLRDPKRKRRAHLLLLAGAGGLFLIFWVVIQLSLASQKSQTRQELATLMEQINDDLTTAENRHLTGDDESANAMLLRAEERARQVMDNESGLYRSEALDLLDQIRLKGEEINNIIRIPPRLVVNVSAKNPDVVTLGLLPVGDGEFTVYDKQNLYRVLLNSVGDPEELSGEELIMDATTFGRFQTRAFMTTTNSLIELINGQATTMKTDAAEGWPDIADMETYLRYLYVLVPDRNQIFKYERLSNRYGPPAEYNVNGELQGAIDMAIDGSVYLLKEDGIVLKLFRGEEQPFTIRNLPENALQGATKVIKSERNGTFYFLVPGESRIVVATNDGELGESSYIRQYVLEGEQVGTLVDLWVDADDTRLYVLDEKRLYQIDLQGR